MLSIFCLLYALATLPLALALLLYISRTLMMPIAAAIALRERSGPVIWGAVGVGFIGAAVSFWPSLALPDQRLGVVAALLAAVASAGSQTAVRRLTATNSAGLIVLIYTAASVASTAPLTAAVWVTPPVGDWPLLAGLGFCAALAQLAAARAYALAPVGFLAPLDLLGVPAGAALGFLLFGEVPSLPTAVGAAVVLLATGVVVMSAAGPSPRPAPQYWAATGPGRRSGIMGSVDRMSSISSASRSASR